MYRMLVPIMINLGSIVGEAIDPLLNRSPKSQLRRTTKKTGDMT